MLFAIILHKLLAEGLSISIIMNRIGYLESTVREKINRALKQNFSKMLYKEEHKNVFSSKQQHIFLGSWMHFEMLWLLLVAVTLWHLSQSFENENWPIAKNYQIIEKGIMSTFIKGQSWGSFRNYRKFWSATLYCLPPPPPPPPHRNLPSGRPAPVLYNPQAATVFSVLLYVL